MQSPGRPADKDETAKGKETDPLLGGSARGTWLGCALAPFLFTYDSVGGFELHEWLEDLCDTFGWKLIVLLHVVQHLLKGFAASLAGQVAPYLYRLYQVPAPQMQIFEGVSGLPWAMKPIFGLFSDIFPIRGYKKAPYMWIASILGIAGFASIGFVPVSSMPINGLVLCMFATNLQCSTCDLLSEAKYSEKIAENPAKGPGLMTYVWSGMSAFGLLAVLLSGPAIYYLGAKMAYAIAAIPAALVLWPVSRGYLEEREMTSEEVVTNRRRFLNDQTECCILCVLMFVCSMSLMIVGLAERSPLDNSIASAIVFIVILIAFSVMLNPAIAKFNAFSLIQTSLAPSVGGAAYFFFTDNAEQYPEGPHFSPFFFNSVLSGVGGALSLLGIYTYQKYMTDWSYRSLLTFTNVVAGLFSLLDIVMFTRTNLAIGIPDHAFVLGSSVLTEVLMQWMWMPQVVIQAHLCPKGMEATMYALLAGCHNLGSTISGSFGALLLQYLEVTPDGSNGESAKFDNLWKASAVSSVLPLITILSMVWLIPNAKQTERLIGDEISDATSGSLFRQWWLRDSPEEP